MPEYDDLDVYSDWVNICHAQGPLFPDALVPAEDVRRAVWFTHGDEQPIDVQSIDHWTVDGIEGEEISWSVGFGPPTRAWFLKPAHASGPVPGVLGLYDHGHFKFYGKEKIADGQNGLVDAVRPFRDAYYGGRAFANAFARAGFGVLIHDTFLWGSRKFPFEAMPELDRAMADAIGAELGHGTIDPDVLRYHGAAYLHENHIAKYCDLLGTSLAAVTAYEDRVALNYLASRDEIDPNRIAGVGFSGGGLRAALLGATANRLAARVVAGMMSTYEKMLSRHIIPHTWMLFPAGWSRVGDFPDWAGCAAPKPLLLQSAHGDQMFPETGLREADARIRLYYDQTGEPDAYRPLFYGGSHRFDLQMQDDAIGWLREHLA